MKGYYIALGLLCLYVAAAAHAAPAHAAKVKPPAELNFTLSPSDVMVISDALGNLPYRKSNEILPLLRKMQAQINAQVLPAIQPKRKP